MSAEPLLPDEKLPSVIIQIVRKCGEEADSRENAALQGFVIGLIWMWWIMTHPKSKLERACAKPAVAQSAPGGT